MDVASVAGTLKSLLHPLKAISKFFYVVTHYDTLKRDID